MKLSTREPTSPSLDAIATPASEAAAIPTMTRIDAARRLLNEAM
jgi:hypothetical protein